MTGYVEMEESPHPILLLTPEEIQQIQAWISQNGYSLDRGHFELVYDYWIFGPGIRIQWHPDGGEERTYLELREGYGDDPPGTVDNIDIAGRQIRLVLPLELRRKWLREAARRTEAEVNADCEPSGSSVFLKIGRNGTQTLIRNEWIDLPVPG